MIELLEAIYAFLNVPLIKLGTGIIMIGATMLFGIKLLNRG